MGPECEHTNENTYIREVFQRILPNKMNTNALNTSEFVENLVRAGLSFDDYFRICSDAYSSNLDLLIRMQAETREFIDGSFATDFLLREFMALKRRELKMLDNVIANKRAEYHQFLLSMRSVRLEFSLPALLK